VSSSTVYDLVTERIIAAMSEGVIPWRKPWRGGVEGIPTNAVSRRPYRGVNLFLLGMSRYSDHRWCSFKQAQELGGNVRKGEKSSCAIFWKMLDKPGEGDKLERIPILRYYSVFNVEQCEGLKLSPLDVPTLADHERIDTAEEIVRAMPNPPRITEGGNGAWYMPSEDRVNMPPLGTFESPDGFYATLFHELGHSTGHKSRLNRPGIAETVRFGSADYGREELVAELSSAFLCASVGLDNSLVTNSAAYCQSWLKALRNDPKMVVVAAAQAQRAADHIRGVTFGGEA
jgi:antirestriction protein ArdC